MDPFAYALYGLLYALPLGIGLLLGFRWIRPDRWWLLDWVAVLLPGVAWFLLLDAFGERGRSLSNLYSEWSILALAVAAIGIVRSRVARYTSRLVASLLYLVLAMGCCLAFYFLFPAQPE